MPECSCRLGDGYYLHAGRWTCSICKLPIPSYTSAREAIGWMRTRLAEAPEPTEPIPSGFVGHEKPKPPAIPNVEKLCSCGCGERNHRCYGCGQFENADGAYRICGECGHVFPSEDELLDQDLDAQVAAGLATPERYERGDEVFACPVCNHDF